jgi:phage-related protein
MEFSIEFYETSSGRCPVQEFLDQVEESDPDGFVAVLAGLSKLRNRECQRPPLSKPIGNDLYELRHVGKLNTRMIYFFMEGRRIVVVHGVRKKARVLSMRDRKVALDRKRDWVARHMR